MTRRYLILFVFSLFTLSGCALNVQSLQTPEMIQAESLLQQGKNSEAATIYKGLAGVKSSEQNYYRLLAADAFIRLNDITQAVQYLDLVDASSLNEGQVNHLNLLQAQIKLTYGEAEKALAQLKTIQSESFNAPTKIAYYQTLSFAYSLTGDAIQSAQALVDLTPLISTPEQRKQNYEKILSTLSVLSEQSLFLKQPVGNTLLNGWMSLERVFKLGGGNLTENLAKWRKSYPIHPANTVFLIEYVKNYQQNAGQSSLLAVFLPESGAYAAPAAVIKKGFMKAFHLAKEKGTASGEVRFYDTVKTSSARLYKDAIKDGAQLVVGPLDKKDIKALVDSTELSIPVLALNQVDGLSNPKLYQFALNPVDDANQITLKARKDRHQRAVFLVPKTEQGKRFSGYLTDKWKAVGGETVAVQAYDDSKSDFSKFAKQLLNQQPETEVDALIVNAYSKPARLLLPQLRKNKVTADLPIYATSQVFLGDVDANRDKPLNDVTFCDVPWVFTKVYTGELGKAALHDSWEDLSPSFLRLLPMGIDAYLLTEHLDQLKTQPFNGATGKLKLDKDNRITRELLCAKFINGVPKVLDVDVQPEKSVSDSVATKKVAAPLPELPSLDDAMNALPAFKNK